MAEAEERIVGGVIDSALKAVQAAGKASREAERQIEAFAVFVKFDPSTEDQATAPGVTVTEMRATLAVARIGSFTNAAIELGVSQPGLSRQVQRVERAYGFDIFDRSVRAMLVTPRGHIVLEAFNEVMNTLARSVEAVSHLS
jgi:hypothetical protein